MSLGDEFGTRSHTLAQRFLQTAVVVDDEAYPALNGDDGPKAGIVAPGRGTSASRHEKRNPAGRGPSHDLDAGLLVGSFSKLGIICGVVGPEDAAMETMRQADIVILDWRLQEDDPDCALNLLRDLLTGEADRNSLRLVAIYTGEQGLQDIGATICAELRRQGLKPEENETKTEIQYQHGRVVLYAKSDVNLASPLIERSFAEENLPGRLVEDFTHMTEGLLPGIALTSLTAVREGAHKVLDRFCAELDPAFLAHMACLSCPEEAERQIVSHIAEELRGLADEAVAAESPAGKQAAERWIQSDGRDCFEFGPKRLNSAKTKQLVTRGLEAITEFSNSFKKKAFEFLSAGFAQPGIVGVDERLAWIMSFRTLYNAPAPTLWLGSIVTMQQDGKPRHLICMSPRCDSIRLNEETSFIFLPLVEPENKWGTQLVIKLGSDFCRMSVLIESASLVLRNFNPSEGRHEVVGIKRESDDKFEDDKFEFADTDGERYEWRGELKAEYAQRIAQNFAAMLSRQAIDESEWLRGMAKK